MMKCDSIFKSDPPAPLWEQCVALRKVMHERSADIFDIYHDIEAMYSGNLKTQDDLGTGCEEFSQFLKQVDSLLGLISTGRSADCEAYIADWAR